VEQVASHLELMHFNQRGSIDMQAHRWFNSVIRHVMDVPRAERPQRTRNQFPSSRNDPRGSIADLSLTLGESAAERHEGAGTPAMVVPVGALSGQPAQQPRFTFPLAGEPNVVTIDGVLSSAQLDRRQTELAVRRKST
jgi:hypothetical protein